MEAPQSQQLSFVDKVKSGLRVVIQSLKYIKQHPALLFFPVLAASLIVASIGLYEAIYYHQYHEHITSFFPKKTKGPRQHNASTEQQQRENATQEDRPAFILFALIITAVAIFSSAFANVALSYASTQAFTNMPISIGKSLLHTLKKLPTLLVWTLCALLIHMLTNMLKNKEGKSRSFLARLVGDAIEIAWYLATFLIIPVMAHEDIGALASIKKSAQLMKKTFGENVTATIVLQGLIGLILVAWMLLSAGMIIVAVHISSALHINFVVYAALSIIGILLIGVGVLCTAIAAATTVFKTAAYHYALGNPVGPFSEQEIRKGFVVEAK